MARKDGLRGEGENPGAKETTDKIAEDGPGKEKAK